MSSLEEQIHPPASQVPHYSTTYPFIDPLKYRNKLKGQVVLIPGAGKGMGRLSALEFAAAGAKVACVARSKSDIDALAADINRRYAEGVNADGHSDTARDKEPHSLRAIGIAGDVIDQSFAPVAVKETHNKLGPVDVLVNNAGISWISELEHEEGVARQWNTIETSLLGAMSFTQAVLNGVEDGMLSRRSGTVINVVSIIGGKLTFPYFASYGAAKAAMLHWTKCIHLELMPKGVKTFAVHPCMSADTDIGTNARNMKAMEANPEMVKWFHEQFLPADHDKSTLAADTFVAIVAEPEAEVFCGRYLDATYDLGEQIRLVKEGKSDPGLDLQ